MIRWICSDVSLDFWLEPVAESPEHTICWVKKSSDARSISQCEKYRVYGINGRGEVYRIPGLPTGWGFKLTADRKIKELR